MHRRRIAKEVGAVAEDGDRLALGRGEFGAKNRAGAPAQSGTALDPK